MFGSTGSAAHTHGTGHKPFRVAVIGGGPGGLFSAWHLASKLGTACEITVYEASDRLGGKIITKSFPGVGIYEAGVAEIYDYSALGPDPLRDLITEELGLTVRNIAGGACVMDGKIILTPEDLKTHFGEAAGDQVLRFKARCAEMQRPDIFYFSERHADNAHPWARRTAESVIREEMPDAAAQRYVRVMGHSDVAAPTHLTNGLTFLKNALMDIDGYLDVISVDGGNEQIIEGLVELIDADFRLNSRVRSVEPLDDGSYRLEIICDGKVDEVLADYVIAAVPLTALSIIEWRSPALQKAMISHVEYFDRPGHYLRATLLFKRPFWREFIPGDWWMSDAFDGCCIYDEGARQDLGSWGALGFLITGNAALGLANVSDEQIEKLCLDWLPPDLAFGRALFAESRVQRWMATVNAMPGGFPVRERRINHRPEPQRAPGFLVVGDYMFDATVNGVLDSADTATDLITADVVMRRKERTDGETAGASDAVPPEALTHTVYERYLAPDFVRDMLAIAWELSARNRVLLVGAQAAALMPAFRRAGINAWSASNDRDAHLGLPPEMRRHHVLGKVQHLPFEDRRFDAVIETELCHLPRTRVPEAIAELKRVSRVGVVSASVNSDLCLDLLERYGLVDGVRTLISRWEWADLFLAQGMKQALGEPGRLSRAWQRTLENGAGPGLWHEDAESVLYSFFMRDEEAELNAEVSAHLGPRASQRRIGTHTPVQGRKMTLQTT